MTFELIHLQNFNIIIDVGQWIFLFIIAWKIDKLWKLNKSTRKKNK